MEQARTDRPKARSARKGRPPETSSDDSYNTRSNTQIIRQSRLNKENNTRIKVKVFPVIFLINMDNSLVERGWNGSITNYIFALLNS